MLTDDLANYQQTEKKAKDAKSIDILFNFVKFHVGENNLHFKYLSTHTLLQNEDHDRRNQVAR